MKLFGYEISITVNKINNKENIVIKEIVTTFLNKESKLGALKVMKDNYDISLMDGKAILDQVAMYRDDKLIISNQFRGGDLEKKVTTYLKHMLNNKYKKIK